MVNICCLMVSSPMQVYDCLADFFFTSELIELNLSRLMKNKCLLLKLDFNIKQVTEI